MDKESNVSRDEVTDKIVAAKVRQGLKWADVAAKVGLSKEWVTAACLGQMTLNAEQAAVIGEIFSLSEQERRWLTVVPYKGSLPTSVPTDPLIYRFYELVNVYGTTIKELIHEGNATKIIIKTESGHTIIEVPLTIGAVAAILAPVLAAVGAVAALVTRCTIVVVREKNEAEK